MSLAATDHLLCYGRMVSADITTLLRAWGSGDESVSDELFQSIYSQLRILARHHLRANPGTTLTPTVLINEAFLELASDPKGDWRDRVQFFAFTATVMRRSMSAHARRRAAAKRAASSGAVPFEESAFPVFDRGMDVAKLDDALTALAQLDPAQARIVELRFFGGLSVAEVAMHLGLSERTVIRQWGLAKAWLATELGVPLQDRPAVV
ncbi:MAG: sigma-70 family RNA polymerase sigma factor [Acidobacteria bacterium]|nr:sigma-70 family RNA polymerase sigma factor [Acidobacteriota bacterium]